MITKAKLSLYFTLILTATFLCCVQKERRLKLNSVINFLDRDSVTLDEINSFLDTTKSKLLDNSFFLNFKIGQDKAIVLKSLNGYIKEKNISTGYESYDTLLHYYYKIPTRVNRKGVNINFKVDVKFMFGNDSLSQISLSLFAPCDWVPKDYKQTKHFSNLDELDKQILDKEKGERDSEFDKRFESIQLIGIDYVSRLYDDVKQTYMAKYGKPKTIKNNLSLPPFLTSVGKYKVWRKSQEASLLWISNGRWIEFNYPGTNYISQDYYVSGSDCKDIYIGTINYTSVNEMTKRNKKLDSEASNESYKRYKDSIKLMEQKREKERSEKLGI